MYKFLRQKLIDECVSPQTALDEGKSVEEIGKQLGMRPEEIFRLSEFSKEDFLKMMVQEKKNFSKAEYITKI